MESWLYCDIAPGQFPDEYAVAGEQHDGRPFSLFAPKELVRPLDHDHGRLRVKVFGRQSDLILIRLPRHSLENGQFVTVRADRLEPNPLAQTA
jgi:hypothetical protein